MHPLWIVLIGVAIVIGGVLILRLHAFLALILAAIVAGALTPKSAIERYQLEENAVVIEQVDVEQATAVLQLDEGPLAYPGARWMAVRWDEDNRSLVDVAELTIVRFEEVEHAADAANDEAASTRAMATIESMADGVGPQLQTSDLVVSPDTRKMAQNVAGQTVGERVANAFGATCAKIGILIAMAAIIGKCLLDSGAADKIVRSALRWVGERRAPAAFVGSGFLLGIPVFFDTVFYLMIPLGKALRLRTGRNYLLYVLSIVAGGTMAHSLVPPTPGPLFVAEELNVDLGLMILLGTAVGLCASGAAYVFASFLNRHMEIPLRESADLSLADLEKLSQRDEGTLPPLWLALCPIGLPVLLIAGYTVMKSTEVDLPPNVMAVAAALGNKNIALAIAAVIALAMLAWSQRASLRDLSMAVQAALASGGVIILITSAGGAFGKVLQQTGIAGLIRNLPPTSPVIVLLLAFLIAVAIRSAQGSATVSMITSVGVLASLADQLPFHPVYLALAIGCGSKPIAWMNDSGFWVICKMSGMTEAEGLRTVTPMSIVMGISGLAATVVLALILPLR